MLTSARQDPDQIVAPPRGDSALASRRAHGRPSAEGHGQYRFAVPDVRCGGCVASIERAVNALPDVVSARVNLTLHRLDVTLADAQSDPLPVTETLATLGFPATPMDLATPSAKQTDAAGPGLLRAVAVAGFGAMNIMLLSVAVWAGAEGATRDTFHLVSGLIALPVVAYAGQPFFRSALSALRNRRLNMDVPISLAVVLAVALSLFETFRAGEHVFFDAAVTLLFFLLIGRYLDQRMRDHARSAVSALERLTPSGAMVQQGDGSFGFTSLEDIAPDMVLRIAPGERVPLDVRIAAGATDIDRSVVTGEAMPVHAGPGDVLEAGTQNLTGEIEALVLRGAEDSFLNRMIGMLGAAEQGRSGYVRIADRAARLYAPVVHLLALATFAGWLLVTAGDWQTSLFIAISVLIITCPCALGLAVPVAQVVAAGRLMRGGILMKDGAALERLAEIDRAVFDKTGTLTTGTPLVSGGPRALADRAGALALARDSVHPAARAIAAFLGDAEKPAEVTDLHDLPGYGVEGVIDGRRARLGQAAWVGEIARGGAMASPAFAFEGAAATAFDLSETLRPGAPRAVADLSAIGIPVAMLSGDSAERAARIAQDLGITDIHAGMSPDAKIAHLDRLRAEGHKTLMVGDGLNDAAALAGAHVSMAPATASDVGRSAADFVFLRDTLDAVPLAHGVALATARVVRQNFGLAIAYNCIAIPLAMAGHVTPLIAALAMSGSSILVIANALRLNRADAPTRRASKGAPQLAEATT